MKIQKALFLYILILASIAQADFSGTIHTGLRYDSNVSMISDYELDLFSTGEKDFLIKTSDDAIVRIGSSLNYDWRYGKLRFVTRLFLIGAGYIRNGDKNYLSSTLDFSIRKGGTKLTISTGFVPRYRSRAYIDEDCDSAKWAEYRSVKGEIELRQRTLWRIYIGGKYEFRDARYCDYFPEYDAQRHTLTIYAVRFSPVYLKAEYKFYASSARGYDNDGEERETSDESDVSYRKNEFSSSIGRDVKIIKHNAKLSIGIKATHRVYISDKEYSLDPLHVGRDEWTWAVQPEAELYLTARFWTSFGIEYFGRRAYSEFNPEISALRDYDRVQSTIAMGWNF